MTHGRPPRTAGHALGVGQPARHESTGGAERNTPAGLRDRAARVGCRSSWAVEETFQIGKGQVGLDHYQCRTWTAGHRFTVLAMAALAILVAITTVQLPPPARLAPITVPETRRIINALTSRIVDVNASWQWSLRRRRHRATAETSHHKQRQFIESEKPAG
jgi:hypothetical protein